MAYDFTATLTGPDAIGGRVYYTLVIEETECAAGSEWEASLPFGGPWMITSFTADLISGTGVTIRPELGLSAGWILDAAGHLDQVAVAAAHVHSSTTIRAPGGSLYGRSQPNAGADNTATTTIVLVRGHL